MAPSCASARPTHSETLLIESTLLTRKKTRPSLRESCRREVRVRIETNADIVAARQQARALGTEAGFSICDCTLITTAVSEITRNILEYATRGDVTIRVIQKGPKRGIEIVAADQGPGIADIAQVMLDGYSTRRGMGIGLPGTKRLMTEFRITSIVGCGTTVVMKKWNG